MIQFFCHSCGTPLQVAEAHIGATVACPKCKSTLQVPVPAVVAPQLVAPVVFPTPAAPSRVPLPPLPPTVPAYPAASVPAPVKPAPAPTTPARSGARAGLFSLWRILVLAGAGLLFLAFFLPWWSLKSELSGAEKASQNDHNDSPRMMSIEEYMRNLQESAFRSTSQASVGNRKAISQALEDSDKWYSDHFGRKEKEKLIALMTFQEKNVSITLWGWDAGAGITGLIFFFLITAVVVLPVFLPVMRPWAWTGFIATFVLGLILLILSMVWLFGSPGGSVGSLLSQGISIGPFIGLLAALLILTGAIKESISGLVSFIKEKGARKPALA